MSDVTKILLNMAVIFPAIFLFFVFFVAPYRIYKRHRKIISELIDDTDLSPDMPFGAAIEYIEEIRHITTDGVAIRDEILRFAASRKIRVWGLPPNKIKQTSISFENLELIPAAFLHFCTGISQAYPTEKTIRAIYRLYIEGIPKGTRPTEYLHVCVNRSQIEALFHRNGFAEK